MNNLCPICKTSYPPDVKFCIHDGARLVNAENPAAQSEPQIYNPFERKPEVGLPYYKASAGNRFLALLLDSLIFSALLIPGAIALAGAFIAAYGSDETLAIGLCILGVILIFVPLGFQLLKDGFGQGQSPGKKALKLMVIDLDTNTPCTRQKSFLRNIILLLAGLVPFIGSLIEPIMVLATKDGRRLGDRAANTMVIEKSEYFS